MPQIQIQNEKKLFAKLSWRNLISQRGLSRLEAKMAEIQEDRPALAAAAQELLDLCSKLPVSEAHFYLEKFDSSNPSKFQGQVFAKQPVRGWLSVESFASASPATPTEAESFTPEALGWLAAAAIAKREAQINDVCDFLKIARPQIYGARSVLKRSAGWTIAEPDAQKRLSCADSFALFISKANGEEGFLDSKGECAPLGGARLFESAEAAQRTISSRRIVQWDPVIVRVEARAVAIDPLTAKGRNLGPLGAVIAEEEARQLREALQQASVETLRARLAELEATQAAQQGATADGETSSGAAQRKKNRL